MEDEQNLTYFFDDIVNYMRVAGEVFELYAEYITKSKFMHAQVKEAVFEEEGPKEHFENFMKNGTNKYMLRKSLENILPNYINRIKKKYVRPGNNSFLVYNKLHDSIQSMLHEENNNTLFKSNLNKIFEKVSIGDD